MIVKFEKPDEHTKRKILVQKIKVRKYILNLFVSKYSSHLNFTKKKQKIKINGFNYRRWGGGTKEENRSFETFFNPIQDTFSFPPFLRVETLCTPIISKTSESLISIVLINCSTNHICSETSSSVVIQCRSQFSPNHSSVPTEPAKEGKPLRIEMCDNGEFCRLRKINDIKIFNYVFTMNKTPLHYQVTRLSNQ